MGLIYSGKTRVESLLSVFILEFEIFFFFNIVTNLSRSFVFTNSALALNKSLFYCDWMITCERIMGCASFITTIFKIHFVQAKISLKFKKIKYFQW